MFRFSIITITYNSEKTIERTLKSVLNQTCKDYEYVIVDGASKDGTMDIVRRYEPLFEGRMKWQSEPDTGIYNAMNKGIERSSGDIIGIVNSDDWLEADALDKINDAYRNANNAVDVIYAAGMNFHTAKGEMRTLMPNMRTLKLYSKIGDIAGVRHPAAFVPRNMYKEHGTFDERMKVSADADFLLRVYKNTNGGGIWQ